MKTYSVRLIYDSFQGEGSRAGCRAVIVRLAGCNMWNGNPENRSSGAGACAKWCDTDFQGDLAIPMLAWDIARRCSQLWPEGPKGSARWILLTGGEPLLQADLELLAVLRDYGFKLAVETNGTTIPKGMGPDISQHFDYVCVSPQLTASDNTPNLEVLKADDLKITTGGAWTATQLKQVAAEGEWKHKYVVPLDPIDSSTIEISHLRGGYSDSNSLDAAVTNCLKWVKDNPEWRVGVQLQKVLNLE